ncbi:cytoplasmic dynein 2 intermediate chain 1 isoform X7 [Danio rerio]|uniref:Cytoplasmic dynein 2 intermediate chain 1 isoform X7 n=1 Tax=Danio rerio TaxID=7955 RepID=A0AC58G5D6_DANRE
MRSVKKITKEDTWRSDDLKVHIQAHNEESRRRSKRVEEHRKHRDGESEDRRHRDPDRDPRREKEKRREREGSKHRDPERDRNQDIKREDVREDRHKERRREREKARHGDGDEDEKRYNRDDKENGERRRDREKDRNVDMYNQEDKERERDRRRAERARRKEERGEGEKEERERDKERERERRERHRARESDRYRLEYDEKQREGERRERHSDKEHSGHKEREHRRDREDKERRRRDKESHMAKTSHSREAEHHRQELKDSKDFHGIKDGESEKAREERERRHERKHKEASDSKRSDREQKQDLSGHDLNARISRDKEVENEETEQDKESSKDDRNHYEEDFEDYEEDFEDVDEDEDDKAEEDEKEEHENKAREDKRELSPRRRQEIEAIQRAMDEENERIYSARSKPSTADSTVTQRDRLSNANQTRGTIIDFVSAKQREISQKVARKQKKRSEELLRLIDLDFSITFSMLDLPPVNEYDMYIKNFGTANTKQAYVQCNEDSTDRDIQTEDVEMTDKWTQHPPEAKSACGGSTGTQANAVESIARTSTDSKRLTTFLRSAAQVMAVLVEENMAQSNSVKKLCSKTDALSFSDGCIQLNTKLPFLNGRQVSLLQFSQVQRQTLLSVHPPSSKNSSVRLDSETVVCVWNIWEPSRPQKILLYESEVKCCCFSPGKVTLVFAGTAVGSVIVWDLREHSGSHSNLEIGKEVWTLRYPTFSTDAVLSGVGHLSPVVSIEPVIASADMSSTSTLTADIEECMGLSFQLGSLDENGVLTLWVVIELPKGNDSGSQTDLVPLDLHHASNAVSILLGLRPGGKVKLLHSSSLQTTERLPKDTIMGFGPSVSLQLKFLPSDSNHYFIGTNMGLVRHGTRHSLKVLPKVYRSQSDSYRPVEVTALDFSPLGEPFFLIGCSDGSVRLHSVLREDPLMEWAGRSSGAPILSVQWSQTRPAVFCVLDAASDLHIWDLTEKDYVPVITENIHSDRVTAMAVFGEPAKQNTFSGIALAKQSGKVEIQYFKKSLTVSSASDKEKIDSILHDAFLTRDMR